MKDYLPEAVLWVLLAVPFFLSGTLSDMALAVSLVIIFFGIYLIFREDTRIQDSRPNRMFLIFCAILLALLPFSIIVIHSVPAVLWWFAYLGAFLYAQCAAYRLSVVQRMCQAFVAVTALFGLNAVYLFIQTGLSSYTRLDSVFGFHNLYGGFLLLPCMISVALVAEVWHREGVWQEKFIWMAASAFLCANIILTFSRGTWLSAVVALALVAAFFWKQVRGFFSRNTIAGLLYVVIACGLMVGTIWFFAGETTHHRLAASGSATQTAVSATALGTSTASVDTVGVFTDADSDNNAFIARVFYFKDAINVFAHRPWTSFGLDNYAAALAHYKTDPEFYSSDPHNIVLRMFAETGIIGGLAFIILILSILYEICRLLKKRFSPMPEAHPHASAMSSAPIEHSQRAYLYIAICSGLVATALHGLMDIDWHYYELPLIFFLFAGALIGVLRGEDRSFGQMKMMAGSSGKEDESSDGADEKTLPAKSALVLLTIFAVFALVSAQLYRAENASEDGAYYFSIGQNSDSVDSYTTAIADDPYDPDLWFERSKSYFELAQNAKAMSDLAKAISLYPADSDYYSSRAILDNITKNADEYHRSILLSIQYDPASDLTNYVDLVGFDIAQKNYAEALSYISRVVPIYTHYKSTLWFTNDPSYQTISKNLALLTSFQALIEKAANAQQVTK